LFNVKIIVLNSTT